jgi:hypothetical protein
VVFLILCLVTKDVEYWDEVSEEEMVPIVKKSKTAAAPMTRPLAEVKKGPSSKNMNAKSDDEDDETSVNEDKKKKTKANPKTKNGEESSSPSKSPNKPAKGKGKGKGKVAPPGQKSITSFFSKKT